MKEEKTKIICQKTCGFIILAYRYDKEWWMKK